MNEQINWKVLGKSKGERPVVPNHLKHEYDFQNLTENSCLKYGERFGDNINLVWGDSDKGDNIRFERETDKSGDDSPIRYDEPSAINVQKGKYLVYESGRWGINLGWSDKPRFEWRIRGEKGGTALKTDEAVALYSTVEKDYLIYEERDSGINLKWFKDSGKYRELEKLVKAGKAAKDLFDSIF